MAAGTTAAADVAADRLRVARRGGFIGACGVGIAALVGGPSPLALQMDWARTGPGSVATLLCFYGGLSLLVRSWIALRRATLEHRPPTRELLVIVAIWALPLLLAPPVASRDLYAYTAQGTMVAEGLNPYDEGPEVLGEGPVLNAVDPLWRETPVPYGPAWLAVSAGAASVPGKEPVITVILLRIVEVGALLLLAWSTRELARRIGRDPDDALVLAVANPLVLVHGIGGGHNDLLLVAMLMAALALALDGRNLIALALVGLAAGIKVPAILVAGHLGWTGMLWPSAMRSLPRRVLAGAVAASAAAVVLLAAGALTGLGTGWWEAINVGEKARSFLAPATWAGLVVGDPELFHGAFRLASFVAAGVILLFAKKYGVALAPGLALLVLGLFGPIVHPWYLLWGLPLVAVAIAGKPALLFTAGTAIASLMCHPGDSELLFALGRVDPVLIVVGVTVAVGFLNPVRCVRDAEASAHLLADSHH